MPGAGLQTPLLLINWRGKLGSLFPQLCLKRCQAQTVKDNAKTIKVMYVNEAIPRKICLRLDFFQTALTPPPLYFWNASRNFLKTLYHTN